jgi:tRNA (guanine-N7-)-methyltransferase
MTAQQPAGGQPRTVRSFVRRAGRVTRAQARALTQLWPRFGVEDAGVLDLDALFARRAARFLEIGFGMGDALAAMAAAAPQRDFLGIDVHEAGIGRLLALAEHADLHNLRVLRGDAVVLLRERLAPGSLDGVLIFFPDPWPKKRHHKRRLIQSGFIDLLACRVKPRGLLHLATDWAPYAEQMLQVVEADGRWRNLAGPGGYAPDAAERPQTRFQSRGERLGHRIFDLRFRRVD